MWSLLPPTVVLPTSLRCYVGSMSICTFFIYCSSLKFATIASGHSLIDLFVFIFRRITSLSAYIFSEARFVCWVNVCR